MKKTKLRQSSQDPRGINRTLFNPPFTPSVNFALEDPLLLASHPEVQKNGLSFASYFGAGSPLSKKASEFIHLKQSIEKKFAEKMAMESSFILPYEAGCIEKLPRSFLSSQLILTTPEKQSYFKGSHLHLFSENDLFSLKHLLETTSFDHTPVIFLPALSNKGVPLDMAILQRWKQEHDFFLIVEDTHQFGLKGFDGFGYKRYHKSIDLLITHIPKTFGKTLSVLSGNKDILATMMEYSFKEVDLFFAPCYLGMLAAMLEIIPDLKDRREKLQSLEKKLLFTFPEELAIQLPLLSFSIDGETERNHFTKSLVDKGFLLPASSFTDRNNSLQLHLNYLIEEKSIGLLYEVYIEKKNHTICESI
ncbi:hypothetical protein K0U07_01780 [bacterium]|nr:hypothetical protein [bacterium]